MESQVQARLLAPLTDSILTHYCMLGLGRLVLQRLSSRRYMYKEINYSKKSQAWFLLGIYTSYVIVDKHGKLKLLYHNLIYCLVLNQNMIFLRRSRVQSDYYAANLKNVAAKREMSRKKFCFKTPPRRRNKEKVLRNF